MRFSLVTCLAVVALSGCLKKIPGTEIDDTTETRSILATVDAYRMGVETRNAQAVIDLADETFRDNGGSSTADDDLEYKTLFTALPARFQKIDDVKLDLSVRRIEFDDNAANARVTYTYTMSFRMPSLSSKMQNETDIKQMFFHRAGERDWKIISGI